MTWYALEDFTTGRLVSASDWNKRMGVSGNLAETAPAKATAAGQLFRATGAGAIEAFPVGSAGQPLVVNAAGTTPQWGYDVESAWAITHGRRSTAATGQPLTLQAGGAHAGDTNRDGGSLFLSGGIATGNAGSKIGFLTARGGSSGMADVTPTERWQVSADGHFFASANNQYDIGDSLSLNKPRTGYFGTALAIGTNPAASGVIRIPNNQAINGRNGANTGDVQMMALDTSNNLVLGASGSSIFLNTNLLAQSDDTHDIGETINRFRHIWISGGLRIGSPTGGQKGAGTGNFAADVYKNNSAYANPDYALEHWATGRIDRFKKNAGAETYPGLLSLDAVESYAREHFRLPNLARFGDEDGGVGIFARADVVLELLEELHLRLFEMNRQIRALGAKGV